MAPRDHARGRGARGGRALTPVIDRAKLAASIFFLSIITLPGIVRARETPHLSTGTIKKLLNDDPTVLFDLTDQLTPYLVPSALDDFFPDRAKDGDVQIPTGAIYTDVELKAIDDCLDYMEQHPSTRLTSREQSCSKRVNHELYGLVTDLLLTHDRADILVGPERAGYYKQHPHQYIPLIAARGLGQKRLERYQRMILSHIESVDPLERGAAVGYLHLVSSSETLRVLIKLLDDPSAEVRLAAAAAMEEAEMPEGRPYLMKCLGSQNTWEFFGAVDVLKLKGPVPVPARERVKALARGDGSGTIADRLLALDALQAIDRPEVIVPIYARALRTGERHLIEGALSDLNVQGSSNVLTHSDYEFIVDIAGRKSATPLMKSNAFGVLSMTPHQDIRKTVVSRYRDSADLDIRKGFTLFMIRQGEESDLPWLIDFLEDADREVRANTETALRHISGIDLRKEYPKLADRIRERKRWWAEKSKPPHPPVSP